MRCKSCKNILSELKLCESAEKRWRRIHGFKQITELVEGANFVDGIKEKKLAKDLAMKEAA